MPRATSTTHSSSAKHSSYTSALLNDSHSVLEDIRTNTANTNINVGDVEINTQQLEDLTTISNTKLQSIDDRLHGSIGHTENTISMGDGSDQLRTVGLGYDRTNQKVRSILVDSGGKQVVDNPTFDALIGHTNNTITVGDGSNQLRTVPLGYDRTNGKAVSFLIDAAGHQQIDIVSSALPSGGATSANQSTIIGHLDGVEGKLDTLETTLTEIATDGNNIQTLITSSNTKLDTLETTLTEIATDGNNVQTLLTQLDVVQDNALIKLGEIETSADALISANHTDLVALEASLTSMETKQDTQVTHLSEIEGAVETIEACCSSNKVNVNIASGSATDVSALSTHAKQDTIIGHLDGVETLLTAANVDHAANEALLTTIDEDTNNIKNSTAACATDLAAIEVLLTAANTDHAANEVLLTAIDSDTNNIKNSTAACATDLAALEVLQTATNGLLTTIDSDTNDIKTDMAAIEVLLTSANTDHAANEALLTTIDEDTNNIKNSTAACATDLAAIEVLLTAANTDHAANEVLLTAIDSDTNNIKNSTAACATDLAALEVLQTATNGLLTTIDSDTNDIKVSVEKLDNCISSGNELQVDVVAALPAGTNNIGDVDIASALPAGDNNIGNVDIASAIPAGDNNIGNVDIASSVALTVNLGATDNAVLDDIAQKVGDVETAVQVLDNIVIAEDTAHSSGDSGVMALAVHQTTSSSLGANGDYTPLSVTSTQHLRTAKELYNFSYTFPSSGTIGSGNMAESNVLTFTEKVSSGGYTFFVTSAGTANHEVGIVLKGSMDGSAYFTINSSLYATGLYNDGGTTQYFTIKDFNIKNIKIQITNNSSSSDDFEVFVCH